MKWNDLEIGLIISFVINKRLLLFFTLHWWPLAFLILSPPLQNFHVVLPTKKCLLCFLSLPLDLFALFLVEFFSFSLSFSCSIFQICGHDNLCKLNTLDNTYTETISAFHFRLYWLFWFSLLYKTLVAMRIPTKITSNCIWVAIPVDWIILHWYTCGADERSLGRAVGVRSRDYQIFMYG